MNGQSIITLYAKRGATAALFVSAKMAVTIELERELGDPVMGIDEAGRGPLVGGVYAAAVSVPLALAEELLAGAWSGINDSKKLTEKKRERLAEVIKSTPGCKCGKG